MMKKSIKRANLFDYINYGAFTIIILLVLYPLYWILIASISNPNDINAGKVLFLPKNIVFEGYRQVFISDAVITGFINSILYTVTGTMVNLVVTLTAGYSLSRKDLPFRGLIMVLFIIPLYFSGGLIPTYLVVDSLGLVDTFWVMIIPNAMSVLNVILARTFFLNTIPRELLDSAYLDGCSNYKFFTRIAVPLSTTLIAILIIYYGVGHWNSYMHALIYIRTPKRYPLQVILRGILIESNEFNNIFNMLVPDESEMERAHVTQLIRYAIIVISNIPILITYPFLQKYFEKGVMIGSLKG